MGVLALLLLPKCSTDLNMAPAHPHATRVAVYPALLFRYDAPAQLDATLMVLGVERKAH